MFLYKFIKTHHRLPPRLPPRRRQQGFVAYLNISNHTKNLEKELAALRRLIVCQEAMDDDEEIDEEEEEDDYDVVNSRLVYL